MARVAEEYKPSFIISTGQRLFTGTPDQCWPNLGSLCGVLQLKGVVLHAAYACDCVPCASSLAPAC